MRLPLIVFPSRHFLQPQERHEERFSFFVRLPSGEQIKPRHLPIRAAGGVCNNWCEQKGKYGYGETNPRGLRHWQLR